MKLSASTTLIALAAFSLVSQADAVIVLSLQPGSQTVTLGDSLSMDLVIFGLGDHASPTLDAFDFSNSDLSYDAGILSAGSVAFGNHLDLDIAGSLSSSDLTTPGEIHMDELSLESGLALTAAQPSSFTLATLNFVSVGAGLGTVSITGGTLLDIIGQPLPFISVGAQVQVVPRSLPEAGASTMALMIVGLLCLSIMSVNDGRQNVATTCMTT